MKSFTGRLLLSTAFISPCVFAADDLGVGLASQFGVIVLGDYEDTEANTTGPFQTSSLISGDVKSSNSMGGHLPGASGRWVLIAGGNVDIQNTVHTNNGEVWIGGSTIKFSGDGRVGDPTLDSANNLVLCEGSGRANPSTEPDPGYQCTGVDFAFNTPYTAGTKVVRDGVEYQCLVAGWCSNIADDKSAYSPGIGWAFTNAWTQLGICGGAASNPSSGSCYNMPAKPSYITCYDQSTGLATDDNYCWDDTSRTSYKFALDNSIESYFLNLSTNLSLQLPTTDVKRKGKKLEITLPLLNSDPTAMQIINISQSDLLTNTLTLDYSAISKDATIIFNVTGINGALDIPTSSLAHQNVWKDVFASSTPSPTGNGVPLYASNVIFNFPDATSIEGQGIHGMMLAPRAAVKVTGGTAIGPLVTNTLQGHATASSSGFGGTVNIEDGCIGSDPQVQLVAGSQYPASGIGLGQVFPYTVSNSINVVDSNGSDYAEADYDLTIDVSWLNNYEGIPPTDASAGVQANSESISSSGLFSFNANYLGQYEVVITATQKSNNSCSATANFILNLATRYQFN